MAVLISTRGLGHRGGLLATGGLGRRLIDQPGEGKADSQRFHDHLRLQIEQEDDLLLVLCRSLITLCR